MSVERWIPIHPNSSLIQYYGEWDTTSYVPLKAGAGAALNFTGSGIFFAGYGDPGDRKDQGFLIDIDPESDSPYQGMMLRDYSLRDHPNWGYSGGGRWFAWELPPGQHVINATLMADDLNPSFDGFEVLVNATYPADDKVTQILENQTLSTELDNGRYFDLEYYGNSNNEINGTRVVIGRGSGFAFSFEGLAVSIYAQDTFEEDTPYNVYFNVTGPPDVDVQPYGQYMGKAGAANQIFWAGDLPAGEHRVVVVNQGDQPLAFSSATLFLPQFYNNVSETCWSGCKSDESSQGVGIGTAYQQGAGHHRTFSPGALALAILVATTSVITLL